jgi:hypothetical protein
MHGGLSPDLNSMEQIRRVMRPTDVSRFHCVYDKAQTNLRRSLTVVFSAICCGLTQTRTLLAGARTTEVSVSHSVLTLCPVSYKNMTWT